MKDVSSVRFIPEAEAEALRAHLEKRLRAPVTLDLFVEPASAIVIPGRAPCELCEETRALLEELASLSERLTLHVHDVRREEELARQMGVRHVPTLILRGAAKGAVRYVGIPAGLEFGTLLEDLEAVGRGTAAITDDTRLKLAAVTTPVHIQVFVTPTCPYCPRVAGLAHRLAIENGHITADVVEISEFPDLAAEYKVQGVPKVVINDSVEFVGAQPEEMFVDAVLEAAGRPAA